MSTMPLRYNIINQLINEKEGMTPKALHDMLAKFYPGEKQCSESAIDGHLMSMRGVGLVAIKEASIGNDGELTTIYVITEYGEERAKRFIGEYLTQNCNTNGVLNTI